jgi:hypothetical protein
MSTLSMNKIFIWAPKNYEESSYGLDLDLLTNRAFSILQEVGLVKIETI